MRNERGFANIEVMLKIVAVGVLLSIAIQLFFWWKKRNAPIASQAAAATATVAASPAATPAP